jgi:hypothetical protein
MKESSQRPSGFWFHAMIVGLVLSLVAGLGFLMWKKAGADRAGLIIPPGVAIQKNLDSWDAVVHPPARLAASGAPYDFSQIKVEISTNTLNVQSPQEAEAAPPVPERVVWEQESNLAKSSEGPEAVEIALLGSAWIDNLSPVSPDDPNSDGDYRNVDFRFFNPQGDSLTLENALPILGRRFGHLQKAYIRQGSHSLLAFLRMTDFLDPRILRFRLIDQASKASLSNGYSYSAQVIEDASQVDFHMRSWRSTPAWLVVDVVDGPPVVKDLDITGASVLDFGDFQCRFLGLVPGVTKGWSSGSDGASSTGEVKYTNKEDGVILLLGCSPDARAWRPEIEMVAEDGQVYTASGNFLTEGFMMASLEKVRPEKIVKYRVAHRPHMYRYILPIQAGIGLPEEKENLARVRIPYFRADSDWQLSDFIRNNFIAINFSHIVGQSEFPAGYFPKEFKDFTVEELLNEIMAHTPNSILRYDPKEARLEIEQKKTFKEKLEKWLRFLGIK